EIEFGLAQAPAKRAARGGDPVAVVAQGGGAGLRTRGRPRDGRIRAALKAQGTPIGPYDLLNAGMALARGLTLVTHNGREYRRVAGLLVADWVDDELT
ncbi:hypothetical protein ACFP9V_26795, partial [Deinococcus radiopugnans]|uniref:hypothetical protein n=1 Tax=Deinococcus radiopugnans TaxID=57497 RepID=UPI00361F9D37